ncbi:hypothetical protein AVEN_168848-1, partial [Araneus ventricosus]
MTSAARISRFGSFSLLKTTLPDRFFGIPTRRQVYGVIPILVVGETLLSLLTLRKERLNGKYRIGQIHRWVRKKILFGFEKLSFALRKVSWKIQKLEVEKG